MKQFLLDSYKLGANLWVSNKMFVEVNNKPVPVSKTRVDIFLEKVQDIYVFRCEMESDVD